MPKRIQDVLLALAFLACGGHHILLRLLSLHLCNEYLSFPKKKKKKKNLSPPNTVSNLNVSSIKSPRLRPSLHFRPSPSFLHVNILQDLPHTRLKLRLFPKFSFLTC